MVINFAAGPAKLPEEVKMAKRREAGAVKCNKLKRSYTGFSGSST